MKKITILLAVMILTCCTASAAGIPDVSSLTLDELLTLRGRIDVLLSERLSDSTTVLYPYSYSIGEHIPAGRYLASCAEVINNASAGTVGVCAPGEYLWNCSVLLYPRPGNTFFLELKEGDTFIIDGCTLSLTPWRLPSF